MSEALSLNYREDGRVMGSAIAAEAIVRCTDPAWGRMITKVIFRQPGRATETLDAYMEGIEAYAGISRDEYLGTGVAAQDLFEQGLFEALATHGALDDRTEGPY